jgi:hypothetical protein
MSNIFTIRLLLSIFVEKYIVKKLHFDLKK